MNHYLSVLIFLIAGFLPLRADAEVEVSASVSQTHVGLEDEIELTVIVRGGEQGSEPALPPLPGFSVIPTGTSSSIQIINTQMSFQKIYTYTLIPKQEGTFTINPISVFSEGREYQSQPIAITVSQSAPRRALPLPPSTNPMPFPPMDTPAPGPFQEPSPMIDKPYWISTTVSNKTPYVNEQIIFTFRLYTAVTISSAELHLPEFKDFWIEELVPEKKYYQDIEGRRYLVSEKIIALYPLQSGQAVIDETTLRVEVPDNSLRGIFDDPFFGFGLKHRRPKNLRASPLTLEVKPLPPATPEDFANLVGQYSLASTLSEGQVKAGESLTLTVEISGKGNVKDAVLPKMPDIPNVKVYDDKPVVKTTKTEDGIHGKKTFKKALVPSQPGDYEIPALGLSYFDPGKGAYGHLETPAHKIHVLPSASESSNPISPLPPGTPQPEGRVFVPVPENIASIHEKISLEKKSFSPDWLALFLFILPPLFFGMGWFYRNQRPFFRDAGSFWQARGALRVLRNKMKKIKTADNPHAASRFLDLIREYIGVRCKVKGRALTRKEIFRLLEARMVNRDLTARLDQMMGQLETASYGGGTDAGHLDRLRHETADLLKAVDRKIK